MGASATLETLDDESTSSSLRPLAGWQGASTSTVTVIIGNQSHPGNTSTTKLSGQTRVCPTSASASGGVSEDDGSAAVVVALSGTEIADGGAGAGCSASDAGTSIGEAPQSSA